MDMEAAREYLNCVPSYALELRQWFTGDNYPNLAEVAFEKIRQANRKFEYADDELRSDCAIEDVYNQQEAFQRYFPDYCTNCNTFIPNDLFNHGEQP